MPRGFFDDYPLFYSTSRTGSSANRLNARYCALIEANRDIIAGSRILDIASHDGRWTFAAIANGARHVLGIEARPTLVQSAARSLQSYGVAKERYSFIVGDVHHQVTRLSPDRFDVVFCFGFFYHTLQHAQLLGEIRRLASPYLLLDTRISADEDAVIRVRDEGSQEEGEAASFLANHDGTVLTGMPSLRALEKLLTHFGFAFRYHDWHDGSVPDWTDLKAYEQKSRVSLRAWRVEPQRGRSEF